MKNQYRGGRWSPKRKGETAQLLFRAQAAQHGFTILDPHGDSRSYDVAVQYEDGPMLRIPVKSARTRSGNGAYACKLSGCRGAKPYTSRQIDFVAAYIFPEKCWYIIPIRALHCNGIKLKMLKINYSGKRPTRWLDFEEAWKQLREPDAATSTRQRRGANGRRR